LSAVPGRISALISCWCCKYSLLYYTCAAAEISLELVAVPLMLEYELLN
jgi:hypothetical protein